MLVVAIRRELRKAIKQITNNPVTIKFIHIYKELTKTVIRRTDFITKPIKKKLKPPISLFIRRFNQVVDRLGRKRVKWASFGLLGILIVVGLTLGTVTYIHNLINSSYNLPVNEQALIGQPDKSLLSQFIYNAKDKAYFLDKSAINSSGSVLHSGDSVTVGGSSKTKAQFSLELPINSHLGITTYDDTSGLSFTIIPLFSTLAARQVSGHTVYPMGLSGIKAVYTIKTNGVQEDIIYASAPKGTVKLQYKLKLPSTLQARMMSGGNLGIYSASPALFGNISYGSPADEQKVQEARQKSDKDNLVFVLPAPQVITADGRLSANSTQQIKLALSGNIVTITASGLGDIYGPLSIDPSVVVTSASDFMTNGNNEGDITYDSTNNQITESGLSGGTFTGPTCTGTLTYDWCSSSSAATGSLPSINYMSTSAMYNGYIYELGGYDNDAVVDYTALNSSTGALSAPTSCAGTITGDWCASTSTSNGSLPASTYGATSVAYSGYVYVIGSASTTVVDYTAVNSSTGALSAPTSCAGVITGDWCASTSTSNGSLPPTEGYSTAVINNNYVYEISGSLDYSGVVDYTALNSSTGALSAPGTCAGTITGDWCTSTSTSNGSLSAAVSEASSVFYNGYAYVMGGYSGGNSAVVEYTALNSSTGALSAPGTCAGTITGDWCYSTSTSNGSLPNATIYATSVVYAGYVYNLSGSGNGSEVEYAAINSNGILTAPSTCYGTISGDWCYSGSSGSPSSYYGSLPNGLEYATSVMYNSYVYEIGGYNTSFSAATAVVSYAAINSSTGVLVDAGIAPWNATDELPYNDVSAASVAYNGYVYEIGGQNSTGALAIVSYTALNSSTGALSAPGTCAGTITGDWCASTSTSNGSLPAAENDLNAVAYNGYVYTLGSANAGVVSYTALTANGALSAPGTCAGTITGDWCASTSTANGSQSTELFNAGSVIYNGYIYFIGGETSLGATVATVSYTALTANGALSAPGTCAGTVTGDWCYSTSTANGNLPGNEDRQTAVVYNGYIYYMSNGIQYTAITSTGALSAPAYCAGTITGDWCQITGVYPLETGATAVVYNGYIYYMGGVTSGAALTNLVYYWPISSDGAPGTFITSDSLPQTTATATSVAYNGYVYEIGGEQQTGSYGNIVVYAQIAGAGVVGSWTTNTNGLPTATYYATSAVYNNYIYEIGGNNSAANVTTVNYAAISASGAIGSWGTTGALPVALDYSTSVVYASNGNYGYVYVVGGYSSSITPIVEYAGINPTGGTLITPGSCPGSTTGDWCASTSTANGSLPAATSNATSVIYNNYIYVMSGETTGNTPVATVDYTTINPSNGALVAPTSCAGTITGDWCASTSTATGNLPATTYDATSVMYNGYLYEIGGETSSGVWTTAIDYSVISSNGALVAPTSCAGTITGDWCASTSTATGNLPAYSFYATAVVYNGYVYVIGGDTSSAGGATPNVEYSVITSTGALAASRGCPTGNTGDWCASTSTANGSIPATGIWGSTSQVYNGFVYELGGAISNVTSYVYYAPINNGIQGTTTTVTASSSAATGSLPVVTEYTTSVAYNGYIYEMGGYTSGSATAVVNYAALTAGGALAAPATCAGTITGDWCASTSTSNGSLPINNYTASSAVYNGYVYVLGGVVNGGSTISAVAEWAAINSNGSLAAPSTCPGTITGDWCASTSTATGNLPSTTDYATSVAYNGYLYEIGGAPALSGSFTAAVDYAAISSTGSLAAPGTCAGTITGDWCGSTSTANGNLPAATEQATSVVYNGNIYVIGGDTSSGVIAAVYYAAIGSNGSFGSWTATTSLQFGTMAASSVAYNGYLYEIGGYLTGGAISPYIYYASINNSGAIGPWTITNGLVSQTQQSSAVAYNGYLYEVGGTIGTSTITAVVEYAGLQSIPRVGFYSRLIDFTGQSGNDPAPIEIVTDGGDCSSGVCTSNSTNPGLGGISGPGGIIIKYRFASNACTTFNSLTTLPTGLSLLGVKKPLVFTTDGCSNTTDVGRYMWISYYLDDSQTATFPDQSGNHTSIADFTVYYHPASNHRLRGGATFSNGSLQSLDAP
jgi:N-acetylneuraminic acid mutarotase